MGWILFRSDLFAHVSLLRARFVASRTLVQSGLLGFEKKNNKNNNPAAIAPVFLGLGNVCRV
jgi:hypothetical protein